MPKRTDTKTIFLFGAGPLAVVLSLVFGAALTGCGGPAATTESPEDASPPIIRPVQYDTLYVESALDRSPELRTDWFTLVERAGGYPEVAKRSSIGGEVAVYFVVSPEGETTNIQLARSIHPDLDRTALRMIQQATFSPGMLKGRKVPVLMKLPVSFNVQ